LATKEKGYKVGAFDAGRWAHRHRPRSHGHRAGAFRSGAKFSQERMAFGHSISQFQSHSIMLADMATEMTPTVAHSKGGVEAGPLARASPWMLPSPNYWRAKWPHAFTHKAIQIHAERL